MAAGALLLFEEDLEESGALELSPEPEEDGALELSPEPEETGVLEFFPDWEEPLSCAAFFSSSSLSPFTPSHLFPDLPSS